MLEYSTNAVAVLVTTGSHDEAIRLGEKLVENRLAACVQILPQIESIYRWKDQINHDSEFLLIAKTTRECLDGLEASIRSDHSYETPEIVVLPVMAGYSGYLNWINESVNPPLSRTDSTIQRDDTESE